MEQPWTLQGWYSIEMLQEETLPSNQDAGTFPLNTVPSRFLKELPFSSRVHPPVPLALLQKVFPPSNRQTIHAVILSKPEKNTKRYST